jgi:hypothetical protein
METAEIRYLPDQQKRDLCLELLDEFGAGKVRERGPELHHNCTLPFNGHTDNNSYAASVNYKDLVFNCYVCGHGGPLSWWIAVNRGEDTDAVEPWLRKKLGIGSSLPLSDLLRVIDEICRPTARTKTWTSATISASLCPHFGRTNWWGGKPELYLRMIPSTVLNTRTASVFQGTLFSSLIPRVREMDRPDTREPSSWNPHYQYYANAVMYQSWLRSAPMLHLINSVA